MSVKFISLTSKTVKLYDGLEPELYSHTFEVCVDGYGAINIKASSIDRNSFNELREVIDKQIPVAIAEEKHFLFKKGLFPGFVGTDDLSLRYLLIQDLVLVFSIGEYQPARYIFYFEGAWKII